MVITVVNININFRGPKTHRMPRVVRFVFVEKLPKVLFMKQPAHLVAEEQEAYLRRKRAANILINGGLNLFFAPIASVKAELPKPDFFHAARSRAPSVRHRNHDEQQNCRECAIEMKQLQLRKSFRLAVPQEQNNFGESPQPKSPLLCSPCTPCNCPPALPHATQDSQLSGELKQAIGDIIYVAEMRRLAEEDKMIRQEWKFIGAVLDRILLILFVSATLLGTFISFLSAPNVFTYTDQEEIIRHMIANDRN